MFSATHVFQSRALNFLQRFSFNKETNLEKDCESNEMK